MLPGAWGPVRGHSYDGCSKLVKGDIPYHKTSCSVYKLMGVARGQPSLLRDRLGIVH